MEARILWGKKGRPGFFLYTLVRISIPFFFLIFSISQFWLGFIFTPPHFSLLFLFSNFSIEASIFFDTFFFPFIPPHLGIFLFFISYSKNTLTPSQNILIVLVILVLHYVHYTFFLLCLFFLSFLILMNFLLLKNH